MPDPQATPSDPHDRARPRTLLDAPPVTAILPATITVAATAQELVEAIQQGAEHIEVRGHLNFWAVTALAFGGTPQASLLGAIPARVKSIQVRPRRSCPHLSPRQTAR